MSEDQLWRTVEVVQDGGSTFDPIPTGVFVTHQIQYDFKGRWELVGNFNPFVAQDVC